MMSQEKTGFSQKTSQQKNWMCQLEKNEEKMFEKAEMQKTVHVTKNYNSTKFIGPKQKTTVTMQTFQSVK